MESAGWLSKVIAVLFALLAVGQAQESTPGPVGKAPIEKQAQARLDLNGDPLPPGALARLGT